MKILAVLLTLVLGMSMSIGVCPVTAAEIEQFTREDAVILFEQAIDCCFILQFAMPYFSDNEETVYFDYSVYNNGKLFDGERYFMVNKNHKYGTLDKTKAWAESIFIHDIADKYVKNVYMPTNDRGKENYLFDNEGNLWKKINDGLFGLATKYNVLNFQSDSNSAVLTVESREQKFEPTSMITNTVKFEKTDAGWRVAESGYFNYYLGIAKPDGSPETGDGTAARAAVFTVGAVLAAAVPAMMLTPKRRRKEK